MTQEDKELLIKDLCGRLPYDVKGLYYSTVMSLHMVDPFDNYHPLYCVTKSGSEYIGIDEFKPYLIPLSSMTEEQYESFIIVSGWDGDYEDIKRGKFSCVGYIGIDYIYDTIDWFIKNYFDYRGLIEKGLALDATGLNIY